MVKMAIKIRKEPLINKLITSMIFFIADVELLILAKYITKPTKEDYMVIIESNNIELIETLFKNYNKNLFKEVAYIGYPSLGFKYAKKLCSSFESHARPSMKIKDSRKLKGPRFV
jgi:hypothetical protein